MDETKIHHTGTAPAVVHLTSPHGVFVPSTYQITSAGTSPPVAFQFIPNAGLTAPTTIGIYGHLSYLNGEGNLVKCRYQLNGVFIEGPFCDPDTWLKQGQPVPDTAALLINGAEELLVFPNPTRQNFVITYETSTPGVVYGQVHNVQGVALYQWQGESHVAHEVNAESWPNGIYVITLQTPEGKVLHKRVVVQH